MATQTYVIADGEERGAGWSDYTPPPPEEQPPTTIFGYNTNSSDSPLSERLAWWDNRAPMVRRYNSSFLDSDTFPIDEATAPEKRVSYSFKADGSGSYTIAGLAAGNGNARLTAFCEDIPAGWTVYVTYYHEVNDDIRDGRITPAQFTQAYAQFRTAIDAATLAANVTVRLASNFMAYRLEDTTGTYWSDSWVPAPGTAHLLTFDIYGNPGHMTSATGSNRYGSATGTAYGTTYPLPEIRFQPMFDIIDRLGWSGNWGILEINTPARTWDTTESSRAQWLVDAYELCLARPTAPEVILLWEAPSGVNWDQSFGRVGPESTCVNAVAPYIEGSI